MTTYEKLTSYWRLEESTGDRVDEIGSNDLYVVNEFGNRAGAYNFGYNAVKFDDGFGGELFGRLQIDSGDQSGLNAGSFSFFITIYSDIPWTSNYIVAKKVAGGPTTWAILIDSNQLNFQTSSDGTVIDELQVDAPSIQTLHIIGVSYNADTKTKTIMVDGEIVASSGAGHDNDLYDGALPFTLSGIDGAELGIDGMLDEAAYAPVVFTDDEWTEIASSYYFLAPEEDFQVSTTCDVRSVEEIAANLKRFIAPVLKIRGGQGAERVYDAVYKAFSAVFNINEIEFCQLFQRAYIENAEEEYLDLHASDYATTRLPDESDTSLRSRLRNIEDKVTIPSIQNEIDSLLTQGNSLIRECLTDGIFCDDDTYFDRCYFYYEGFSAAHCFVLVIPPQVGEIIGEDYWNAESFYDAESFWGSTPDSTEIYNAIWELVDRIRAAGISVVLEIKDFS